MIIATVTTCPQRWREFQRMRKNFESLGVGFPLRVFQDADSVGSPEINHRLNARAALRYCARHLPDSRDAWMLYLEDDIVLHPTLATLITRLVRIGTEQEVDCWFLCNRKARYDTVHEFEGFQAYHLVPPIIGAQGLLLPKRHIAGILNAHWSRLADEEIFARIYEPNRRIFQVIRPVLVEHAGHYSTFFPSQPQELEIN